MTTDEIFDVIESNELSARINVASGFANALAIARVQRPIRDLAERIGSGNELGEVVLRRILDLVRRASDVRYEHRYDTALMVYTHLLSEWSEAFGVAAAALVSAVPNLWWASMLAAKILERAEQQGPRVSTSQADAASAGAESGDLLFVPDVRDVLSAGTITAAETANVKEEVGLVEARIGPASTSE